MLKIYNLIFTTLLLLLCSCDFTRTHEEAEIYKIVKDIQSNAPYKVGEGQTINWADYDNKKKVLSITYGFSGDYLYRSEEFSYNEKQIKWWKNRAIHDILSHNSADFIRPLVKSACTLKFNLYNSTKRTQIDIEFTPEELADIFNKYYSEDKDIQ